MRVIWYIERQRSTSNDCVYELVGYERRSWRQTKCVRNYVRKRYGRMDYGCRDKKMVEGSWMDTLKNGV